VTAWTEAVHRPAARRSLAALAVLSLLPLLSCAQLERLPGASAAGDYVKTRGAENAKKVGENAATAAATGELGKSASFTMEQEFHLGKTIAATVVSRLGERALPPEHPAARYLRDVGTVVALAAAELRTAEDRPYPLKGFRFILVDAPQVNAVGMPGGFVAVTTGAFRAARTEDELAAVIAHEVAHVQRGHVMVPVERAREQEHLTGTLLAGTDKVVHAFFGKVVTLGADFVLDKGYGKTSELEADALAARVLSSAGYDPGALERFLGRLEGKAAQGGFFSRHPPASERAAALAGQRLPRATPPEVRLARFETQAKALP
jgi:beta-barrel assembly-enhancing protease